MYGMKIQLGYSPHADDAYMLYGLLHGKVDTGNWQVEPLCEPFTTLNDNAARGKADATMVSASAYAFVRDRYALLPAGAKFGFGCGPVIVAREQMSQADLPGETIAIPGATTTASTLLQLYGPTLRTRILPFDKLLAAVESGLVKCALVIHEEFVSYQQWGLNIVLDLGQWWAENFDDLPLPMSVLVARKDLPPDIQQELIAAIAASVRYSQTHHAEAMTFAMQYSNGLDRPIVEDFIRKFVNELSAEMGSRGKASLETFYEKTADTDILPSALPLEII
ncbi:MAG: ABC transporter substrate-binding protein [Phycisphaerae bacterium]|nr:ABC transporter substrate-binding protein [Phycisphaerae bacterium]